MMYLQKLHAVINEKLRNETYPYTCKFVDKEHIIVSPKNGDRVLPWVKDVARNAFASGVLGGFMTTKKSVYAALHSKGTRIGYLALEPFSSGAVGISVVEAAR